ncbi:TPA: methionine adenosyltransferase [Streptococcus pyogenes]
MDLKITNGFYDPSHLSYEVVERKGLGHPDTLADGIAEQIEIDYSLYCLDKFGVIPHHNFDKIIIRGGHSVQDFGGSDFIEPIKIIFLGRASKKCFNSSIPLFKIQKKAATKYLNRILPNLDVENYVEFETLTSDFTTKTNWFSPEAIEDLPEYLDVPKANDTATMISYWPLTISEELALMIEGYFYKLDKNELPTPRFTKMGGDIKVMVVRNDLEYSIRINFPLISKFFNNDIESQLYVDKHVEKIKKYIEQKYKNIRQFIKSSDILSSNDIENLKLRALFLLQEEKQYLHGLSEVEWDGILSNTINNIYRYSSEEHSLYLLPLYLLRVYNYLKYN